MAFNLKDEQAVEDLRELAKLDGKSMTAVASELIAESLRKRRREGLPARLMALAEELRADADPEWLAMTQEEMDAEIYDPETGLPW